MPTSDAGIPRVAAARHLEDLGYDAVGMADLLLGTGMPALDPNLVLAAVSSITTRIGLEFGVLSLPLRPVALVAAQVQTLQLLSGGRVVLGVGLGGFPGSPFWQAMGAPVTGRGRAADAALAALPALVRGEDLDVRLAPPAPVPPIVVGGNSEAAMRRAILHGDGWAPSLLTPADLRAKAVRLRELAAELGRPAPWITVGGHAFLSGDGEALEGFVRALVDAHGMPREVAELLPVTQENVAGRLADYREAGAEAVGLALDGARWEQQAEILAQARDALG